MAACASLARVANAAMTPGVICLPCGRCRISRCSISVVVLIYPSIVSCEQITVSVRVVTMDCRDTICPSTLAILSAKPKSCGSPRCRFVGGSGIVSASIAITTSALAGVPRPSPPVDSELYELDVFGIVGIVSIPSLLALAKRRARSPAVACWASDHWVASSNPLRGKFRH